MMKNNNNDNILSDSYLLAKESICGAHKSIKYNLSYWKRLIPIVFILCYLNLTVFVFACGPWKWPVEDVTKLYLFLVLAHLSLLMGYLSAAFRKPRIYNGRYPIRKLIKISIFLNLILLLPTSKSMSGSFVPNVVAGFGDLGAVYKESLLLRMEARAGFIEYVRIFISPLLALIIPLTFYYWKMLKISTKLLSIISLVGIVTINISIGTNKALADLVILIPWLLIAQLYAGRFRFSFKQFSFATIIVASAFCLFLAFFSSTIISRTGSVENAAIFPLLNVAADFDNFLVKELPTEAQVAVVSLSLYLPQGYYGLYLSLEKPFIPMFGVGNSMFLTNNAAKITGIDDLSRLTYPARIEEDGWDSYVCWSSIYPWIASDVSFPGTIIIIFIIGHFFALTWLETLEGSNPFAVALFVQFIIMLFYFPANNQVMQSGESLIAFLGIFILWLKTRCKSRNKLHRCTIGRGG